MVLLTICWHFRDVAAIWHSGNRKKLVPFLSQFSHDDKEELTLIYQRSEIKEMIGNQPLRLNDGKGRFQILVDFFRVFSPFSSILSKEDIWSILDLI